MNFDHSLMNPGTQCNGLKVIQMWRSSPSLCPVKNILLFKQKCLISITTTLDNHQGNLQVSCHIDKSSHLMHIFQKKKKHLNQNRGEKRTCEMGQCKSQGIFCPSKKLHSVTGNKISCCRGDRCKANAQQCVIFLTVFNTSMDSFLNQHFQNHCSVVAHDSKEQIIKRTEYFENPVFGNRGNLSVGGK